MNDSALYYPYINFHNSSWIKAMSLFYDKIYRIVPHGLNLNDPSDLKALIDNEIIGSQINNLDEYKSTASTNFLAKLDSFKEKALTFTHYNRFNNIARLHQDKVDQKIRDFFKDSGYQQIDECIEVPEYVASLYMLFLGNEVSKSNNLALITDKTEFWTAINFYKLEEYFEPRNHNHRMNLPHYHSKREENILFSIVLDKIMPLNIADIPTDKIINFREKRIDQIKNLRQEINTLNEKLSQINDYDILRNEFNNELARINNFINDFKQSTDILGNINWGSLMLATATGTSNYLSSHNLIISGSIGIIQIMGLHILEKHNENQQLLNHPLSCLALMREDLNLNTFDKLKSELDNDMHEFIYD